MLALTGICKSYGTLAAVDDLSLAVARGEVLGLLGPNGAGKSTAVSLAAGLLAPDAGTVAIDGQGAAVDPRFIGFMMMIAGLSRTQQAASGAGWAIADADDAVWRRHDAAVRDARVDAEGPSSVLKAIPLGFGIVTFALGVRGLREL